MSHKRKAKRRARAERELSGPGILDNATVRHPAAEVGRPGDERVLVELTAAEFDELVRLGKRAELLAVADSGDRDKVLEYLAALGIRDG